MLDFGPEVAHIRRLCVSLDEQSGALVLDLECDGREIAKWRVSEREMSFPQRPQDVLSLSARPLQVSEVIAGWLQRLLSGFITEFNLDRVMNLVSPRLSLPEFVLRSIRSTLSREDGETPILWLAIGRPTGYLHLLPWERLLRSPLGVRLLRLPYGNVKPKVASNAPQVALCCSALSQRDALQPAALAEVVTGIADALPPRARIHLFVDEFYRQYLDGLVSRPTVAALGNRLVCHPPPGWLPKAIDSQDEKSDHPWMSWIQEELAGEAVDLVHFVVAAHWSADGSYLDIARNPWRGGIDDTSIPIRYLSAQDIDSFLNRLGAGACVLTSPEQEVSLLGMRELMDQLARRRPGAIVLHDAVADPACQALADSYRFLYGGAEDLPPASDAVSLLCHPWQVSTDRADRGNLATLGIVDEAIEVLHQIAQGPGATPGWVMTCQRYFESEMSKLQAGSPRSDLEEGIQRGDAEALRLLAGALMPPSRPVASNPASGEDSW